jgi:hypothetical protein
MRGGLLRIVLCELDCVCSDSVDADGCMHQGGKAADCKTGHRAGGDEAVEGWVAGVLRRQAGPIRGEAGAEVPDVVHRGLSGGEDDVGRPVAPGDDRTGGG